MSRTVWLYAIKHVGSSDSETVLTTHWFPVCCVDLYQQLCFQMIEMSHNGDSYEG